MVEIIGDFEAGGVVDMDALKAKGLIPRSASRLKILANGERRQDRDDTRHARRNRNGQGPVVAPGRAPEQQIPRGGRRFAASRNEARVLKASRRESVEYGHRRATVPQPDGRRRSFHARCAYRQNDSPQTTSSEIGLPPARSLTP